MFDKQFLFSNLQFVRLSLLDNIICNFLYYIKLGKNLSLLL